ncbi:GAF domain-containing protein [Streptomyces tubercidicus]|uniref:Histidine kinase n=1 Tax=Streptomyces tubercidicus TaxID=47759 RepID=A0A640V3R6_9ACTN|nr:GAF domain-containing protein [Streptomyces tubercidicus]WAU15728.1 GAF domain-containing protein [Streptomyces tubercidicus]GFE41611.1 histidine kinase [Streptomyces tubercidicus]
MRCALKPSDPAGDLPERTTQSLRALAGGPISRLPELLEAMVTVGSDHDLRRALDRIAETAASLTGARHAAIGLRDADGGGPDELITHGLSPEDEPPTGASLEVPIQVQDELFGTLYLAGKDDGGEFGEGDLHLVRVLATEAGIVLSNARMHAAARQRRRWIEGAASVTTALLAGPGARASATHALTVVAEQGRELAEAATGAVLLPHDEGGMGVVAISTGLSEEVRAEAFRGRIPPESPVLHQLHAGLGVFSDDFAADPRSISPLSRYYGPTMLLPLRSNGRVLGALALCRTSGDRRFSHTERTLGTLFAAQAAVALVLADRHRDRERLAVFEDRDRIARDLHDLVIQRLFATGMMLETARRQAQLPEVRDGLGEAIDELDATIQEIRTAIIALQQGPPEVPPGLRTRVLRAAGTATAALGGRPSVRFVGPVDARVDDRGGRELLAALDEALTAVEGSAAAQPARVSVVVDATATLPDGRAGVRLTVSCPDGSHPPLTWERPLHGRAA